MNYIGSKYSLIDFLKESINKTLMNHKETRMPENMVFADLFAGTGVVSGSFKTMGYSIIANDIQYYSYVLSKHMIENNGNLDKNRCLKLINILNELDGVEGFIYKNYSYGGTLGQDVRRMYFSDENAQQCDAIRLEIENWKNSKFINLNEYYFLLGSLINSIDKYANTALVYGAYLKKFKKKAIKKMCLESLPTMAGKVHCEVYNEDAMTLIDRIHGDIMYLDPPYNHRQYCSNYHLLETIAKYDNPIIHGKTGLRNCNEQKSIFCVKEKALPALEYLIKKAQFKYIFMSYNNEGIIDKNDIAKLMQQYGEYEVYEKGYTRFKADKDANRKHKADKTIEYLHCLIKNKGE